MKGTKGNAAGRLLEDRDWSEIPISRMERAEVVLRMEIDGKKRIASEALRVPRGKRKMSRDSESGRETRNLSEDVHFFFLVFQFCFCFLWYVD